VAGLRAHRIIEDMLAAERGWHAYGNQEEQCEPKSGLSGPARRV
jgi:hypothetical protein